MRPFVSDFVFRLRRLAECLALFCSAVSALSLSVSFSLYIYFYPSINLTLRVIVPPSLVPFHLPWHAMITHLASMSFKKASKSSNCVSLPHKPSLAPSSPIVPHNRRIERPAGKRNTYIGSREGARKVCAWWSTCVSVRTHYYTRATGDGCSGAQKVSSSRRSGGEVVCLKVSLRIPVA